MGCTIGIIANPASGKDIRRLVSYATVIDNQEKVNILKRIVLAAQSFGAEQIYFMPDSFQMGLRVIQDLTADHSLSARCEVLELPCKDCTGDTTLSARRMEELGASCIVVLGGDGTSRAAAKGVTRTPLLPISTGTNNVYPVMAEGTVAGMAAAFAAQTRPGRTDKSANGVSSGTDEEATGVFSGSTDEAAGGAFFAEEVCMRDKRIELYINGTFADLALVDVVLTMDQCIGARAIWETDRIREILVTRCHPASIGFSAIAGSLAIVRPEDDFGYMVKADSGSGKTGRTAKRNTGRIEVLAPIAAGLLQTFAISKHGTLQMNRDYDYRIEENCMAALDGERELRLRSGDLLTARITREGPLRVDIKKTLERACLAGGFLLSRDAAGMQ